MSLFLFFLEGQGFWRFNESIYATNRLREYCSENGLVHEGSHGYFECDLGYGLGRLRSCSESVARKVGLAVGVGESSAAIPLKGILEPDRNERSAGCDEVYLEGRRMLLCLGLGPQH